MSLHHIKRFNYITNYRDMTLILLFSLHIMLCSTLITRADDPLFKNCSSKSSSSSPSYTINSTFDINLKLLLKSLPSNTSSLSAGGFYNTSIGTTVNDGNSVYGLALCRGDVTPEVCKNCVGNASREIIQQCPSSRAETIFYELCHLRYSDENFFTSMVYAGKYPTWNNTKQDILGPDQYTTTLTGLMTDLSTRAAFDPSGNMFATGEASLTSTRKLYGLGQCTRDISSADCYKCLTGAVGDIVRCCSTDEGGIIVDNSCNLRYELYRFYGVGVVQAWSPPTSNQGKGSARLVIILTVVVVLVLVAFMGSWFYYQYRWNVGRTQRDHGRISEIVLLHDFGGPNQIKLTHEENQELPNLMNLSTIRVATDNFSDSNKLGHGGFGVVYKGRLLDGNEIAVKRLSRRSWQGLEEYKNEVILIARLQHRNLVKLLGYGIEGEERLLIYEFMPNKSLDIFILDETKRSQLDWKTRFNIILGIARGLLYLHEDSRLKIIHRDLKPSNVLLDHEMNAKISDFGMARIFGEKQSEANTKRIVGTCGYMAPEYAMEGLFSVKSDVFSFGVVLLEILSGKRSNGFYLTEHAQTLLAYVWHLWNEGKGLEFLDSLLIESSAPIEEVLRCLHIGLLCVQEDAADRPTMSSVLVLLGSDESIDLPQPTQPAFSVGRFFGVGLGHDQSSNELTISNVLPR